MKRVSSQSNSKSVRTQGKLLLDLYYDPYCIEINTIDFLSIASPSHYLDQFRGGVHHHTKISVTSRRRRGKESVSLLTLLLVLVFYENLGCWNNNSGQDMILSSCSEKLLLAVQ